MADVRGSYLEAGSAAVELISSPVVGERWLSASVLEGYTVGGLAAHLGRALVTVDNYVQQPSPPEDTALVDAPGYFAAALGEHDPVASEFHIAVRGRGETTATAGQEALVEDLRTVLERLTTMTTDLDRPLAVLAGIAMTLGEYLKTRLVELVVHCRDLTDSVGIDPVQLSDACWQEAAEVVAATALLRHGAERAALSLARPDRMPRVAAF